MQEEINTLKEESEKYEEIKKAIEVATRYSKNRNGGAVLIHSVRETDNRVVGRVRDVKTVKRN